MREPVELKKMLGWDDIVCSTKHFICKAQIAIS